MGRVSPISVARRGRLAVLTVASPPLNLYDLDLHRAFLDAVSDLERDMPGAVLIRFEGRVVSGGVDVALFDRQDGPAAGKALFDEMLALPERIAALPCPTVFAAHAVCLTWAFEVALACDLLLAAERASFGLVERVIGLTPTMGGSQRLAARAGVARAKELVFTGERYPASVLAGWNVVNRVLPADGFDEACVRFAAELADGPTRAHAATKQVMAAYEDGGVPAANRVVTAIAASLYETEDLRGGIRSFLTEGPGKASFTGR